ncbi:MAG: deoxyuridine 5'-triphosphate nucleotidohydrolase [Lachnospiraceae bacterium]
MQRIAQFFKVGFAEFEKGIEALFPQLREEQIREIYEKILLPKRATKGSAGYDFFSPFDFCLKPGETIKIPTGIRVKMEENWVLKLYPRSGLGFKYRLQLNNTVGIIDSDYYFSDNEGHIYARITNDSNEGKELVLKQGDGFMQGIFLEYGITLDDEADGIRNGGFGSTSQQR